jgi:hypothetical protein
MPPEWGVLPWSAFWLLPCLLESLVWPPPLLPPEPPLWLEPLL